MKRNLVWVIGVLVLAAALKAWLVLGGTVPFNSDEAIVALMARHILQGANPVFFYGQAYMGSLDAFLVAGAFWLLGQQVWVVRLVQALLYLGVLSTTVWLGRRAFDSWDVGILAALLLAIPAVNVTLYTTVSLGGYGEALLLGNLILLCGLYIGRSMRERSTPRSYWLWCLLGFLCGLGLWAFGLTLVYSLPVLVYLIYLEFRAYKSNTAPQRRDFMRRFTCEIGAFLMGGLLGSAPWWGYAFQQGWQALVWELSGGAIAGVEQVPWIWQVGRHLVSLFLLGSTVIFGLRPPWEATWLVLPLLPFVLLFWIAVIVSIIRRMQVGNPDRAAQVLLVGVMLALLAGFILTPFGADPSGRYFLPMAVPLALFAAALVLDLRRRWGNWAYGLVVLVLAYNSLGTLQSSLHFPPGITTQFYAPSQIDHRYDQTLIDFLRENGESRGFGNYWVAYPLAFLSNEELIFVPRLPYHLDFRYTSREDRYPPYYEEVSQSEKVAYITTKHPDLDDRLRQSFSDQGVDWREAQIGDYHVFFALSRAIFPTEIGLGTTTD